MFGNDKNEPENPAWTNRNWLKSRFHFSFAEYHNPRNTNFGVLRVMNDDLVQPMRGFGKHGHRDTEICTYVLEGGLTHEDSMGTAETLQRGAIQFMTAGRGVLHSEFNNGETPLRFIQIWINTRTRGLKPNYGSSIGDTVTRHNTWAHLVSDIQSPAETGIKINQDANILVSEIDAGENVELRLEAGRMAYFLCMEGNATLSDPNQSCSSSQVLARHDAAEVFGPTVLTVGGACHVLMVEMQFEAGSGRGDI
jgi:redox-sensitive bicupin YhaK (pirin superfamily)